MTEIEKLYENIKINKIGKRNCTTCEYLDCQNYCFISENNKCTKFNYEYPPFTAEKQLEITKLIGSRYGLKFIVNDAMDYMLSTDLFNDDKFNIQGYGYGFDEAIANLINNLWQSLTDTEKEQIKEVLK